MILPPPTSTLFPYTTLFRSPQDPPDRLDVVVAVGDVRVVVVEPEGDPLGKLLPIALVLEDALATEGVELLDRSEEHTSELQSQSNLVCRLLLEKKKQTTIQT